MSNQKFRIGDTVLVKQPDPSWPKLTIGEVVAVQTLSIQDKPIYKVLFEDRNDVFTEKFHETQLERHVPYSVSVQENKITEEKPVKRTSKYDKKIRKEIVDVYDVLNAFGVTCPASQHAIKKLLMPGLRGHKTRLDDLKEAEHSVQRAIILEEERVS